MPRQSQISLHLPQCPVCGLPMAIALIEPDTDAGADKHVYQCARAHSVVATVETAGAYAR